MSEHCVIFRVKKIRSGNQHEPKGKIEFQPMMKLPSAKKPQTGTADPRPDEEKR